jgi:hypothetical protein
MTAGWQPNGPTYLPWEPTAGTRPRPTVPARWLVITLAGACYVAACALPALDFQTVYHQSGNTEPSVYSGAGLLLLGWLAIFSGQFAWLANPLLICSLILTALRRWLAAVIVALAALLATADLVLLNRQHIPANEGGTADLVLRHPLLACYLWLGSIVIAFIGPLLCLATDRRARRAAEFPRAGKAS